jgi:hypothetical protein
VPRTPPTCEGQTHLNAKRDGLELGPHLVKVLDMPPGADEVLGHDLAGVCLSLLGGLFDVLYQLLFLLLHFGPLPVELPLGLLEGPLVLLEHLGGGLAGPKDHFQHGSALYL